ncbi:glycosyltransferase involved in cell wall biosynthesis [Catalinimonas alkaloidigena]|uniref:glycosyltransferase n=1 Tax=Catalinimonas alkaloidigena TaxID=1075417 RepID=UPI00240757D7|nr:glycosyltransferase [Catalinimonas alkaloidigena]MDF9798363.1 glycosyltransferase involved in cell wall biosynthesis [Catalinimonas alkaloidigena]
MKISVIIPTFNPRLEIITKVLNSLKAQSLPLSYWELIIIDNASTNNTISSLSFDWHPHWKIVKEDEPGLTYARLKGFENAKADILLLVDDDNILDRGYLINAIEIMNKHKNVGIAGGKSLPVYEKAPPDWFHNINIALGCRNLGDKVILSNYHNKVKNNEFNSYPTFAPIGTGMVLRKKVANSYSTFRKESISKITDRKGKSLSSGGDNELVIIGIKEGWEVGYFPSLVVDHIIPKKRIESSYLARMNYHSSRSWVQLLIDHNISPWKPIPAWSVLPRKLKAYFSLKAWKSECNYIKWKGACGMYEGLTTT